jgi:hypothetical protein
MSIAQDQREQGGTVELDAALWTRAVQMVSDKAARLFQGKGLDARLAGATALAVDRNKVVYDEAEGVWKIESSTAGIWYSVNGVCTCEDYARAPEHWCKHRLAAGFTKRARTMRPADLEAQAAEVLLAQGHDDALALTPAPSQVMSEPEAEHDDPEPTVDDEEPAGKLQVPKHFMQQLQGKPFIKYVGLLQLAQARGLVELRVKWTHNDAELSLAHAVAIFEDGNRFEESGDSTPQNAKNIGLHWRRMSLTRAKARALRDALGIDMVSVEEME